MDRFAHTAGSPNVGAEKTLVRWDYSREIILGVVI
jgi:hypothetical protein